MTERLFPISPLSHHPDKDIRELRQAGTAMIVIGLPWSMIAPHEAQAVRNHSQSLERLAERGGLGSCEAVAVLEDRRWRSMAPGEANQALVRILREAEA